MSDNDFKNAFLTQTLDGKLFSIAKQFPDNIAYSDDNHHITYKELCSKVDHLAAIIQKNFPDDEIIGLFFEQSLEFIACFFAVIRSGKVLVPLEINSPENRLLRLFHNAKIKTVIKSDNLPYFENKEINVITYSDFYKREAGELKIFDDVNAETVILYTSGSTGEPKGVIHDHKSLMHCTYRFTKLLGITPTDNCTFLYSTAHMGGTKDMLNALLNGATLHYYPVEKYGYQDLPNWLEEKKITIYTSIVTVFRKLCGVIKKDLKHLGIKVVRLGGELSLKADYDKYKELFPDNCLFISGLASSETGLIRQNILNKDSVITESYIANGYPVEDVEIEIRDEQGQTVEDGVIGTIVIITDYISTGYKNMPELNADRYRINPVSGRREYWSGDTGYIKDGNLVVSGRSDLQIKISGRRIDLSEIESLVMELSGVTNSAALYYEETKSIILFVEIAKTNPLSKDEISQYLATNLPFYMQPTRIITLASLPLTASFKVNKKELYKVIQEYQRPYVEPSNHYEEEVIKVWSKILNKEKIGIYDNFFELGGDSISATAVNTSLEQIFDIKIPYGYLYQAQTAQMLAKAIEDNNFHKPLKWLNIINQGTHNSVPIYWIGDESIGKYLPDDQEIYRVSTHYDHGELDKNLTIEKICSEFVDEILDVNKGRHCIVGGFSMGARYSLEVAKQLQTHGIIIDLLILLDPSEEQDRKAFPIGHWIKRFISNCYFWLNIEPPESFKRIHVFMYHRTLREKYKLSKYDGKVLLFQRKNLKVPFEQRDWTNITDPENLIFYDLDIDDHFAVITDNAVQAEWAKRIKEHIY